jgi:hypothetical protein
MIVGFFPCLGWLNWFSIPFAGLGLCVSIFALATENRYGNNAGSIAGIVGCGIALLFCFLRLVLGGGIL